MKACSLFSIIVGALMLCMWLFFIIAGMVPEFDTRPAEIVMHLTAEFLTAFSLIAAGIVVLKRTKGFAWLYPFATGMLMYTLMVSPGYYMQTGEYAFVIMFGALAVLAVIFLGVYLRNAKGGFNES